MEVQVDGVVLVVVAFDVLAMVAMVVVVELLLSKYCCCLYKTCLLQFLMVLGKFQLVPLNCNCLFQLLRQDVQELQEQLNGALD